MHNARPIPFTALALVALAGATAIADNGVPMGPMMCLYGYNDYRPCSEGPSSVTPSSIPETPPDPMAQYLPRYNAALSRLQGLVGGLDDLARATPQSEEEISARLSTLYAAGAYRLDSVNAVRNQNAGVIARANAVTDSMTQRIADKEAKLAGTAARKQAAVDAYNARAASGATDEHRHLNAMEAAFDAQTKVLATRADQTAQRVIEWLWVAGVPVAQRGPRTFDRTHPPTDTGLYDVDEEDGPALVTASYPRLPMPDESGAVAYRAPLTGTVDEKLSAVEVLAPRIAAATQALESESPEAAVAEERAATIEIKMNAVEALYQSAEGEVRHAEYRTERAAANLDASRLRTSFEANNMLRQAIEVRFLSRLESKAEAAVKELWRINGNAKALADLTDWKMGNLYRAGQVALHLAPGTSIQGMDKFLAVQRKILDDLKNPFQSAIDASNALASSDPNAGSAEAVALFRGLRRDCITYAETAGKSLPPGVRDQAMSMLDAVD